jgi:hypothetical protein
MTYFLDLLIIHGQGYKHNFAIKINAKTNMGYIFQILNSFLLDVYLEAVCWNIK